jgi:hypothetical protein
MGDHHKTCPECGGDLRRVHRHATDRLASMVETMHRYRCSNGECAWEGLLPHRHRRARKSDSRAREWLIVLAAAAIIALGVVYMLASHMQSADAPAPTYTSQ